MKVLLLEDDDSYAETIEEALNNAFSQVKVIQLSTEREFRHRLAELAAKKFDVAIFDIMVRWGDVEEFSDAPPEVMDEAEGKKKWRAGVRCLRLFNEELDKHGAQPVPSLYHSVLNAQDLAGELNDGTELVVKQGNIEVLTDKVRQLTQRQSPQ